ncbi:MAG: quinone-dependent dihydroorotate dehydrogenase [Planctomycetes bacterium]|nr:quinone-dependent dihydroorotate dehydrogenase [Planctomycetota bacterium]
MLYRCARPLLFRLDAERAHELTLSQAARFSRLACAVAGRHPPGLPTQLGPLTCAGPVGLAAGLDKNAVALPLWERLGFGFVEVGTITPRPQAGNPRPRVHRFPKQGAIINAMGFPNDGAEAIAGRLRALRAAGRWPQIPVGANLGKNKDTPDDEAAEDYRKVALAVRELVDYLVVNVSSPNTPGLRALQAGDALAKIVGATREAAPELPVFVKLAPDLDLEPLTGSVERALAEGAAGVVATNTTLTRPLEGAGPFPSGGLSGRPLFPLAKAKIAHVLEVVDGRVPVVGVGGVDGPERARELLELGCAAVQLYTGLVFQGPGVVARINRALRAARG